MRQRKCSLSWLGPLHTPHTVETLCMGTAMPCPPAHLQSFDVQDVV